MESFTPCVDVAEEDILTISPQKRKQKQKLFIFKQKYLNIQYRMIATKVDID